MRAIVLALAFSAFVLWVVLPFVAWMQHATQTVSCLERIHAEPLESSRDIRTICASR